MCSIIFAGSGSETNISGSRKKFQSWQDPDLQLVKFVSKQTMIHIILIFIFAAFENSHLASCPFAQTRKDCRVDFSCSSLQERTSATGWTWGWWQVAGSLTCLAYEQQFRSTLTPVLGEAGFFVKLFAKPASSEALREADFQWSSSQSRLLVKLFAKPTSSEALREADFQWSSLRSRHPVKLFAKPSSSEALREADFQWRSSFSIKVLHQAASRRSSSWSDLPHELGMGGVSGTKNSVCLN